MTRVTDHVDNIARAFHESYERLAPEYHYQTRPQSAVPWEDVPDANRELMWAVVSDLLQRRIIKPAFDEDDRG